MIVHHASDLISADYPGYAVETIKQYFGAKTVAMFAQGCCGDINGEPLNSGFAAAETAGEKLGQAAIKAACESAPLESGELKARSITFEIGLHDRPTYDQCRQRLAELKALASSPKAKSMTAEETFWHSDQILCIKDQIDKIELNKKTPFRFEANALTMNEQWCLLTMPHEMHCEYQRWADEVSPFQRTMVMGYTNGCEGYIPTNEDMELGGAETAPFGAPLWYHHRFAPAIGTEPLIKEKVAALLSNLRNNNQA